MDDRRDDWKNSVDKRLVDLTSAQKSADVDLEKFRRKMDKLDLLLRGDPVRNIKGLIEATNHLDSEINKFNRIFDKDYLGHGGLISFITYVYEREREHRQAKEVHAGYKWGFWGVILAALIGAAAVTVTNKDQLEKWWKNPHLTPIEKKIEKAKHPKPRRPRVVIQRDPEPETEPDPN